MDVKERLTTIGEPIAAGFDYLARGLSWLVPRAAIVAVLSVGAAAALKTFMVAVLPGVCLLCACSPPSKEPKQPPARWDVTSWNQGSWGD